MTAEWVGCLFFPSRPRPRRIIPWNLGPLDQNQTVAGPLKVDWMWPTLAEHALFTKVQPRPPLSGPKNTPHTTVQDPAFRMSTTTAHCPLPTARCTNCRASQVAPTKAKSLKYHGVYSLHSSPFPFPSGSPCFALFYFRSSTSLRMLVTAVQSGVCPFTVVAGPPLCPNVIPHRGNLDPERRHPRILLDPENPLCFLHMEKHSTLLSKTAHITVTPSRLPDLQAALAVMLAFARSCCSRHNDKPRPPCR